MSFGHFSEWRKLPVSLTELRISTTLRCGQTFRSLFPKSSTGLLTPQGTPSNDDGDDDTAALIRHYFNLEPNLSDLYEKWAAVDSNFKKKALQFTGIRILRQDAWEALVSFICSSNNNIARISQMVEKLCINYGPLIGHVNEQAYHDFPPPSALTGRGVEARLRELGFGYRAKYIYQTAVMVANEHEQGWLDSLRNPERPAFGKVPDPVAQMEEQDRPGYREAHEKLLELQGVGPKVADCVCLMGLGWSEAVPVDTHVWQIAQRDYKFGKGKQKSLTKATYDAIGDHFRRLWGKEAGWAHSVLFTADLKTFSDVRSAKVQLDETITKSSNGHIKEESDSEKPTKTKITARVTVKRELTADSYSTVASVTGQVARETVTKRRRTRRR
ncbi:8-oxoguanine glycosylase ogg1 [Emydomyces testavorans]|uniref:N-glycosylase/DNA lyase n=1 Tax=Emydomyces testavorans TaxID=2070801 RepID=A0AAF0IIH4_9EURO|nr:8-oxoguanine glycosylase ogg1 [Emydomyces testavorans]